MSGVPNILPHDEYNEELLRNAHPSDWINPVPSGRYNLVVIGAGTAGLVTAAGAAGLGAKVALVEQNLMGGDCLNVGCVPSKSIIRSSRAWHDVHEAGLFGVRDAQGEVDFPQVMERMRRLRAKISPHDSVRRFAGLGIDVFMGHARFVDSETVDVEGAKLKFKRAAIATGARAVHPGVTGLSEAGFLTNENIFELTELPKRFLVMGGGPIGCEMAQAFKRLGSEVTLLHKYGHVLNREDPDAAAIIQKAFVDEGIKLVLDCHVERVEKTASGKLVHFGCEKETEVVEVDEILAGAGRSPNVENMGLESIGVDFDSRNGVKIDDHLRTTNPRVYAAGDVCMKYKFTHTADAAARIVIQNALFWDRRKLSSLVVPWCTYTDPEIAHVGMYEKDAEALGISVRTFVAEFKEVDRAVADGEDNGMAKVHANKKTGRILGATVVARHAGEMISEITTAIVGGIGLGKLASVIHPYPTQAEAIKRCADAYNKTRLTPRLKKIFSTMLNWKR